MALKRDGDSLWISRAVESRKDAEWAQLWRGFLALAVPGVKIFKFSSRETCCSCIFRVYERTGFVRKRGV